MHIRSPNAASLIVVHIKLTNFLAEVGKRWGWGRGNRKRERSKAISLI
jgi:hypothetical protein